MEWLRVSRLQENHTYILDYTGLWHCITMCEIQVCKLMVLQSELDIISHHIFPEINIKWLICTSDLWWKGPWRLIFTNSLISITVFLTNWNWKMFKIFMQKHTKWMKNSLHHELLLLLAWEKLFTRKTY